MFEPREIELSKKYLKEAIEVIEQPVVVLGGWAIYFLVNEKYRETTGREYIGSRDIDLGFKMEEKDLEISAFAKSCKILIEDLEFRPQSFRLFKEIHAETGEVLKKDKSKDIPSYQIIQIYVDLIVNSIPTDFRDSFGFTPIDEPLLNPVFENEINRIELEEFGRIIWVPTPEILLATKIKSYPSRDKEHKRIKDACDIAALLLFSLGDIEKGGFANLLDSNILNKFKNTLTKEVIGRAAEIIAIDPTTVESAILKII
jgi:hypothetical protein